MLGSATLTIDTSTSVMNPAARQTISAFQRRGSGSAPATMPVPPRPRRRATYAGAAAISAHSSAKRSSSGGQWRSCQARTSSAGLRSRDLEHRHVAAGEDRRVAGGQQADADACRDGLVGLLGVVDLGDDGWSRRPASSRVAGRRSAGARGTARRGCRRRSPRYGPRARGRAASRRAAARSRPSPTGRAAAAAAARRTRRRWRPARARRCDRPTRPGAARASRPGSRRRAGRAPAATARGRARVHAQHERRVARAGERGLGGLPLVDDPSANGTSAAPARVEPDAAWVAGEEL